MDDGVRLLEPARNASQLFLQQPPRQKKRLLNLVLSNCEWHRGEVRATFRQPFDLLAKTVAAEAMERADEPSYPQGIQFGWGARIRTWECRYQKPMPYHLATPQ